MLYKDELSFRPRARLIKIIGEQLISSEVIALVELVRNSYDADATEVFIKLIDIQNPEKGKIIIEDNGTGMSLEKIRNVWLEPATPDKKMEECKRYSKCFNRKLLGEKGIGRFAVHKLGEKVKLVTRATIDCFGTLENYETVVDINWNKFSEDKYLDEVKIEIETRTPQYFLQRGGVYIEISNINPWKVSTIVNTVRKLKALESPDIIRRSDNSDGSKTGQFKMKIASNNSEIQKEIDAVKSINVLLESAFYKIHGVVDEQGILHFTYSFNRPDYPELSRSIPGGKIDLKEFILNFLEELKKLYESKNETNKEKNQKNFYKDIFPGKFYVDFYVWDLDSSALKVAGLQMEYKTVIKPNAGVRVYRDGFRVWPYGEEDDDWLGLDLRRLNAPKERLISRNQIVGFINISSERNPLLIDQSNREGLIKNTQYEVFYELVKASLKHMSNLRKQDKTKMDKAKEKSKYDDEVTQTISNLKNKLRRNKHYDLYKEDVEKIEKVYKERVTDILDRYMQAAAIGISYTLPVHELNIRFKSINSLIKEIEKNPLFLNDYIRELENLIENTQNIVKAIGNLMQRKKRKEVLLLKVVKNAIKIKERELKEFDIKVSIVGDLQQKAVIIENLVGTAFLNLVDNAIYWIRVKRMQLREKGIYYKGIIEIILGEEDDRPFITIKDNGTGIKDPIEMLKEPYYSRKENGYGLGLYIVDNIMTRHNGKLEAKNWKEGAVFKLIFEK
ncbi:histidine kinase [Thermotomaculum hydrothermale]|uniref:histidine kinase n=1 Tax=Thermotomaculum hydrothermale TaxID=981385 RepID=A0A7R6PDT8_9BACT|nr:sensor histidine kinase [Thermotomaculum hydrothermale]BBB31909.1 histidine kinase [Thermotomaculum hydrothermale]